MGSKCRWVWGRSPQILAFSLLLLGSPWGLSACRNTTPPGETEAQNQNTENRLVVENALLEQADADGNILWKLQAEEAVYSQDQKDATLTNLLGNLYEDGEVILSIQASGGQVINDGERIVLEAGVLVTDNRQGVVFETEQAEWQPGNNVLLITNALQARYPNGTLRADQGQYFIDRQDLELTEAVEIITVEPSLRLLGSKFNWLIADDRIIAETGLTIERYTDEALTARLRADRGEAQVAAQTITVSGNVLLNSSDPEIQFVSGAATWDLKAGVITGRETVQLTQTDENTQFRANQGRYNLNSQQAQLSGAVRGTGTNPPTALQANQVDWNLATEQVVATGNVVYEQSNPRVTLNGDRAVGNLAQNQVVVTGSPRKQVATEIVIP
ncbi:LPS export ABC transporter periplasmic protein LptC [Picosynechococcus sp. NKBG15041c]|uniref:LPS export ABC transporter periplasmic protein LptC n=1 Tax=Picosynechococcus sp. NKBG15041c TaxID=1407650 RepID=UPI0009DBC14D|nr:LPS export ABC transporter periplasmic protein LptC [Picosynechococcus sp. NKBG15041c]